MIAFADAFVAEAERLGAARGRAFAVTLRGEAKLLSGRLDEAEADLREAARLSRAIGGAVGEALALQRRAEVALYRGRTGRRPDALLDEALAVARESDVGFHLLDRIYGTRITAAARPGRRAGRARGGRDLRCAARSRPAPAAGSPSPSPRRSRPPAPGTSTGWPSASRPRRCWPTSSCGCRAGTPRWRRSGATSRWRRATPAAAHFAAAADGFRAAGQPLDEARCVALAAASLTSTRNVPGTADWQRPARTQRHR